MSYRLGVDVGGTFTDVLLVDEDSATHVRWIFARFLEIGSCTELAREVGARGIRTPRGNRIDKKYIYRILSNRAYIGDAVHKGESYPGEHDAVIDREAWDRVHAILQESPRKRAARTRADTPALLKGLLFGPDGAAFSPTHTRKGDRLYRYYVSQTVLKHGAGSCPVGRVPAGDIEAAVIDQLANWFGPKARAPRAFFDTSWSGEQWTRGCPVGIPSTGALLAYGPWLRRPVGAIHWAGTETSDYWNGYMDGAVRSGERAAREVLDEL